MNTGDSIYDTIYVVPKVNHYKKEAYKQAYLYRERGFTYAEIAKLCGVSRSTLSNWFAKEPFSKRVAADNIKKAVTENTKRLTSINKARTSERKKQYQAAIAAATVEYRHYRQDPLFMAGLMLYVSAGDSQDATKIRFASSRADLHKILHNFLRVYMGTEASQIKFWLLLYPDLDKSVCRTHWQKKLKLSPTQFYKAQVINGKSSKRTLQYGVGNTIISSTLQKHTLNRWIELAQKELLKSK